MLATEQLASFLENGLNTNSYNIVFDITANYKEFKKSLKNKVRYEDAKSVVYGVLRNVSSEATPVKDLGHYTITCELELVVTTNSLTLENLDNVYSVLESYYETTIGTENTIDSFKIGVNIQTPTTGIEELNEIGGTIPLNLICVFSITKNAYMFNDVKWYIDGTEMTQLISWNINNIKSQETINSAISTINKNIFKNQGLAISFTLPHSSVTWYKNVFKDYYVDRILNKVYTIKYVDPDYPLGISWYMGIAEMPISGEPAKANGVGIVFAEMRDDLVS